MKSKRLTALLLALVMVFALSACANGGKSEADRQKEEQSAAEGKAPSYEALVAAVENAYNDPDVTMQKMMTVGWGASFSAVMQDFLAAAQEMGEASPDQLTDVNLLELEGFSPGKPVKLEIAEASALTDAEVAEFQDQIKSAAESMELIRSLSSVYDNMSEEDLAENGMTPEQVTQMKDYIDKMVKIGEVYAACTVEKGCRLKLNADVDGTASVIEKTVLLVNGSWVFSDFSDMLG